MTVTTIDKQNIKELVYSQNGIEETVPLMLPKDLIKLSYGKSNVTLTILKEDINSFVALAYDYKSLKKAGISVRTLISSHIKKQHENKYVPRQSFNFLGVNIIYDDTSNSWCIGNSVIRSDKLAYNDLLRALLDYSIGIAMQK